MMSVVTVYKDKNYSGSSKELAIGKYDVGAIGGNDAISSIRVPEGLKATLYEHDKWGGKKMICVRDTDYVGDSANDRISSIVVEERGAEKVILYHDSLYRGWSVELPEGTHDLGASLGKYKLSSVILPEGYRVRLHGNILGSLGGGAITRELFGSADTIGAFNDKVTSVSIVKMTAAAEPTLAQLEQLIEQVAPRVHTHPDDAFRLSSVEWFLERATLKGRDGTNRPAMGAALPSSGDDGAYWLELPAGNRSGNMASACAYVNAKYRKYWIDLQFWFFYPYNGAGKLKLTLVNSSSSYDLDPMGQHGGDWERVTFRVELATKRLLHIYLAQHDEGVWVDGLMVQNGVPLIFSSRHGHASYQGPGDNLTNKTTVKDGLTGTTWFEFALRNDTNNGPSFDSRSSYKLVATNYTLEGVTAPSWLAFTGRWGPYREYDRSELSKALHLIEYSMAEAILDALPEEFFSENGPKGPKSKACWDGEEEA
jgi:Vacuolar protein sorting-associated protein 62